MDILERPAFALPSNAINNVISAIENIVNRKWYAASVSDSRSFFSEPPTLTMNIYRNGELVRLVLSSVLLHVRVRIGLAMLRIIRWIRK